MAIRVISGSAKGRKLKTVPGDTTRPIMDRVKENLFNLIEPDYVQGQRWLDLFAGTGAVGIEALSRGAAHCTFADLALPAIRTIESNIAAAKVEDGAFVRHMDAFQLLERSTEPYDVVYIAPPQYHGLWVGAMTGVEQNINNVVKADGIVIVQIDPKEYADLDLEHLQPYKDRTYGNTQLIFYERK